MRHTTTITSVLVTAAVLLVLVGATPGAAAAEPSPLTEILQHHDLAVFEWNRLSQVNTTVTDARLDALRGDGFKTIYVDISEYVEVADQRPSRTQQARLAQLNGELKGFVNRARIRGFAVHAVAGAPNWTSQSRRYLGPMTVDLVVAYNKTAGDDQLQGIQVVDTIPTPEQRALLRLIGRYGPCGEDGGREQCSHPGGTVRRCRAAVAAWPRCSGHQGRASPNGQAGSHRPPRARSPDQPCH
jgi:hypothetical protein